MMKMVLTRIPSEDDVLASGPEAHTFLSEFKKNAIAPFSAKVHIDQFGCIVLGDCVLSPADWFFVEEL